MRFLLLLSCAIFEASALASTINLASRQYTILIDSFKRLNSKIAEFDAQIKTLTLNSSTTISSTQLIAYSEALLVTVREITTTFSNASPYQIYYEAADLVPQIPKLTNNAELVIETLIAKKYVFVQSGLLEIVRKQIEAQRDAIDAFTKAMSSKLPSALRPASEAIIREIGKVYNRGLTAFA
jgi:hypothetical protein